MSPSAKWEYMKIVYERYLKVLGRKEKGLILDEFCKTYDCHRKHALRMLNAAPPSAKRPPRPKRGSPYTRGRLPRIIEAVWEASDYLCGQRLKPALLEWLPDIRKNFKNSKDGHLDATLEVSTYGHEVDKTGGGSGSGSGGGSGSDKKGS